MIRKISQKGLFHQLKHNRPIEIRHEENQYYLSQPNAKTIKTPTKQTESDKQKLSLKYSRKASQNGSLRTFSTTQFKQDFPNQSKEQVSSNSKQMNSKPKVQNRKIRSTSHSDTLRLGVSKSSMKLQLSNRKNVEVKRINLKIESPSIKKQKTEKKSQNFDCYYNKVGQSKTLRVQERPSLRDNATPSKSSQLSNLYRRCCNIIEDYQEELQDVRRENEKLAAQNRRLRGERSK